MYLGCVCGHTGGGNRGGEGNWLNQLQDGEVILEVVVVVLRVVSDLLDGHDGVAVVINSVLTKENLKIILINKRWVWRVLTNRRRLLGVLTYEGPVLSVLTNERRVLSVLTNERPVLPSLSWWSRRRCSGRR